MRRNDAFDEVMIVNPGPIGDDPATGERMMMGYFGEPGGFGEYGSEYEYAEEPYQVGSDEGALASDGDIAGYDGFGCGAPGCTCGRAAQQIADAGIGYGYADPYALGYAGWPQAYGYADPYSLAGWGFAGYQAPYGFAAPWGYAGYGYADPGYAGYGYADPGYAQSYELEGYPYFADATDDQVGDDVDGWYGDDVDGYVPDVPSRFNYQVPTCASGLGDDVDGYVPTRAVSPSCGTFTAAPNIAPELPDTLKPLW